MQRTNTNEKKKPKIYLAGPLFSDAERTFNEMLTRRLDDLVDVYLPQRDGGLMSEMVRSGIPSDMAARRVFRGDMAAIREADYFIAILDGRAIDEGVALELGVAYAVSKRCVGIQTDSRRLASWGNNPMITGTLEAVFHSIDDLVLWMRSETSVSAHDAFPIKTSTQLEEEEPNRIVVGY